MSQYPISDHGLIGNLQTAAFVSTDGNIDWFCASRCDSPSVLGSLLNHDRDGDFKTQPMVDTFTGQR